MILSTYTAARTGWKVSLAPRWIEFFTNFSNRIDPVEEKGMQNISNLWTVLGCTVNVICWRCYKICWNCYKMKSKVSFMDLNFFLPWEMCRQVIPDIFHLIFSSYSYFRQELHYCHIFMNLDWMGKQFKHSPAKSCWIFWEKKNLETRPEKCKELTLNPNSYLTIFLLLCDSP